MKKENSISRNENQKSGKISFSFSKALWILVIAAFAIFIMFYVDMAKTQVKIDTMVKLNERMKDAVEGKYEDKEIVIRDMRYALLSESDKEEMIGTLQSIIEYRYYELADTVYDTSLVAGSKTVTLKMDAVYKDMNLHKSLKMEQWKDLEDSEFIGKVTKYIGDTFEYEVREKIDIPTFIDEKIGQCYSYSELLYLLGKERGMNMRVELSEHHSWNSYVNEDGNKIDFDVTTELEVKSNEE